MTAILATKAARRRGILFTVLLVVTVLMMAFSSNPTVREFQNAIGFAFRPIQGALDSAAGSVASVAAAIVEIDRLRIDNAALRAENDLLTTEAARLEEIRRENDSLTALLQLRAGFDFKTTATTVIARESSEFRRFVTISKGTDDGIVQGDVVMGEGGALAGRVVEVGSNYSKVILITDQTSTVIGQLQTSGASGAVVGQLEGALLMTNIDSTETIELGANLVVPPASAAGGLPRAMNQWLSIATERRIWDRNAYGAGDAADRIRDAIESLATERGAHPT